MPRLAILLLGPPRVELDGAAVSFDTRKASALLAYLSLSEGPQRRDSLADLLWPDYAQGRASLRRTLSALNAAIGNGWVHSEHDTLALERSPGLQIDVDLFQARIADADAGSPRDRRDALRAAVALYRDDFLAGFTLRDSPAFDDWQIAQAERLRRTLARALEQLVKLEAGAGDLPSAVASARRWLGLDPLHEQAHRALMTLHAQAGQRSAAVQQYRECVRILERELGVPPLDETTALYQAISAGERPTPGLAPEPAPASVAPRPPPPLAAPLVGRAAEWDVLTRSYDALGPDGALVVLEGPAGIGKTRLAEEFLAYARAQGAPTIQTRCHEGEDNLALAPFVTLLRQAIRLPGASARLAAVPSWLRSAAAHLTPEIGDGPTPLPHESADARLRLYEGVTAVLLAATSGGSPTIMLLDDLQWADRSSLDLLAFLARRLREHPLSLVATWRDDDLPAGHPLRAMLAEQRRAAGAICLSLAPLRREDVAALLNTAPGAAALLPTIAEQLFAETEGLPLLVVEYMAMLRESGPPPSGAAWELPAVARDLLQARLRRAGPVSAQLLAAAAVIGRGFDAEILRAVSGRSEDEVVMGIEELLGLGIITEGHTYDFSHGKLRELAYAAISLARRRLLHRRAAESLATSAVGPTGDEGAALIARHYQLAGDLPLAAKAFAQAGHYARSLTAPDTAIAHYTDSLALGHPEPEPIHTAIGDLHTLEGRYGAALASYEAGAASARPQDLPGVEARIAEVHRRRGEWALALRHLEAGLEALGPSGETGQRARLTADRSLSAQQSGEPALAQRLAEEALALAEQAGDRRPLAQTCSLLGLLARERGDPAGARAHLERSLALADQLRDVTIRASALHNLALARGDAGDLDDALSLADQALELCEAQGDRHRAAAIHNTMADLLHAAGRDAESMEHLKRAVALFAAIGAGAEQAHPGIWQLTTWT